jgi:hypothetical protein
VSGEHCISNVVSFSPVVHAPKGLHGLLPIVVAANAAGQTPKPVIVANVNPWSPGPVP